MASRRRIEKRLPLYLIPIIIGLCGVLFARQFDDLLTRSIVVLVSAGLPLFAAGHIIARLSMRGFERYVVLAGVVFLIAGAFVTISGLAGGTDPDLDMLGHQMRQISIALGAASLLLGLIAILFIVVRSDEAIVKIGDRFRNLAGQISDGFILVDTSGEILLVNEQLLTLTNMKQSDFVGHHVEDVARRLGFSMAQEPSSSPAIRGRINREISFQVRGEERRFSVQSNPVRNRSGRAEGFLAIIRDVTEERRLASHLERYAKQLQSLVEERTEQLARSEQRMRGLLLTMNEGFLTLNSMFRIGFVNDRFLELLGLPREEVEGREIFEFIEATGRGRLLDLLESSERKAMDRGHQELTLIGPAGRRIPIIVSVTALAGERGESRYSIVVTDVSQLKAMQRQLEIRAEELEAANEELKIIDRAKDTFLSNVSHELRTPLSTVSGYLELLGSLKDESAAEKRRLALEVMGRNVRRLQALIEELLEFSRMEIRGIQLTLSIHLLRGLIEDCVSSAAPQGFNKGIAIHKRLPEEPVFLWGDRLSLGQALSILLSNAIKFSHQGSDVEIEAGAGPDNGIYISVIDHGIGIDPADHERIFEKFYQVDSSHTRAYEGMGIGLSIAKNIAEAHGGHIDLDSEPGRGSRFTLVLPRARFKFDDAHQLTDGGAALRVVLGGDTPETLAALEALLVAWGCDVHEITSGYECLRVVRELRPDVVVLDEVMRDISGADTLKRLRATPEIAATPVLLLVSARNEPLVAHRDTSLGVVVKPYTAREFGVRLLQLAGEHAFEAHTASAADERRWERNAPRALIVDPDPDLLEWLETALRHRRIPCHCLSAPEIPEDLSSSFRPDVVFVDHDTCRDHVDEMMRALTAAGGASPPLLCAMTCLPALDGGGAGRYASVLRKPFPLEALLNIVYACEKNPEQPSHVQN